MGAAGEAYSGSGPGTAVGTDSVRPLSTSKAGNLRLVKSVRPGTVGAPGSKKMRRSDYARFMRSSANQNNSVAGMQNLVDDFNFVQDDKIKVTMQGRNKMHYTASHENQSNINTVGRGQILSNVSSQPAKAFPIRGSYKKNIEVRDMKSNRNATIANIQREIHIRKGVIPSEPQS